MKKYKIIEIMGNFETLVGTTIEAKTSEEAKELIMKHLKDNLDKYMYPVFGFRRDGEDNEN